MAHIFTPALRRPLSKPFAKSGTRTLIQRAIASLRARGSDAHLWLPGGDVRTYGAEFLSTYDFTTWTTAGGVSGSTANSITTTSAGGVLSSAGVVSVGTTYLIVAVGTTTATKFNIRNPGTLTNSGSALTGAFTISFHSTWSDIGQLYLQNESAGTTTITSFSIKQVTSITPTITSGLTTGNYLESTGNTLATVDNPVGLVLDALGTVGGELVSPIDFTTGWTQSGAAVTPISATSFSTVGVSNYYKAYLTVDAWYELTCTATFTSQLTIYNASSALNAVYPTTIVSGVPFTTHFKALATQLNFRLASAGTLTITNISVREVSGIHLTQSTTANKGLLKQDAGSRYYWLFDATDLLTGTFPAGYESVTVIDAKSTGQVTTSAANVVGSYSIGPSYSSYGRIIIKGSITASELALYQGFANRLAGL